MQEEKAMELNNVELYGRVVRDAKMTVTGGGLKIVNFSIVSRRRWKSDSGEWQSKTNLFPLAVYGDYGEKVLKLLKKGQRIIVEGYLKQDCWEKNEKKYYATDIGVKKLQFIFNDKDNFENEKVSAVTESIENSKDLIFDSEFHDVDNIEPPPFDVF